MAGHQGSAVSGFIVAGINLSIYKILRNIDIAVRCIDELTSLKDLVLRIEPIIGEIEQYRQELNRREMVSKYDRDDKVSAVMAWLKGLDALLGQATVMTQRCTTPSFEFISRHETRKRITHLIPDIHKHLQMVPLLDQFGKLKGQSTQFLQMVPLLDQSTQFSTSSASTSVQMPPIISQRLIVGQENELAELETWLIRANDEGIHRVIGVIGKGGAGKTLLLRRIFNSKKVQNLFHDGLLLWLTVSSSPSFASLKFELCQQIKLQTEKDTHLDTNMSQEDITIWLSKRLEENRFALFLDDVWDNGSKLLEELGVLKPMHHSIVIVSSRDHRSLLEIGVADSYTIRMHDLSEECSWQLFSYYAFPYNNGNVPANIDQGLAKFVCQNCEGLPLAIKVIGRAMAGITDPREWELADLRLPNSHISEYQTLYDRLRLSFDALDGVNLQLCFLYAAAAFSEMEVIHTEYDVMPLWLGEGLLIKRSSRGQDGRVEYDDPFEVGKIYAAKLADRCLIEPIIRDVHGDVVLFRIHDVIRQMAILIAEQEESFCCRVGMRLTMLTERDIAGRKRIMLNHNKLSFFPKGTTHPAIRSLLFSGNKEVSKIPKSVIGSMISLQVLELSWTSLSSLPETVGDLKQLVCLRLRGLPIRRLPASLINLVSLEILELNESNIIELPSGIHKLRSLRCLGLDCCKNLEYLSLDIKRLESLEHLEMDKCNNLWTKRQSYKEVASINDLKSLKCLKRLYLQNNGETLDEGTLKGMPQMETLHLTLTNMQSLPPDMISMSKLRRLSLDCSDMVNMNIRFVEFKNLTCLRLQNCLGLKELPELHKLECLKQLDIIQCPTMETFPTSFGETGAFPKLELLSLVQLPKLPELPVLEPGAMPCLKIFSIIECKALKELPKTYLNLSTLQKVRAYGCPIITENEPLITSFTSERAKEYLSWSRTERRRTERRVYNKDWEDEFFIFLQNLFYV